LARERLLAPRALDLGLWDARGVERIADIHQSSRSRSFGLILWRLLMLEAWARHYATLPVVTSTVSRGQALSIATANASPA
jgi:asparagine synthase (glutamine-hydrolysing)